MIEVLTVVIIIHSAIMPVAHTFGLPYALGTLFLEIRGWFAEKLVTLRFQFLDRSVCDGSRIRSLVPLVCVTDVIVSFIFLFGALFGDKNRFTFVGLSVLTCAIHRTFPCQSLVRTKIDPIGNKPFWVLRSDLSNHENGCGC